ncbi:T9SS type B sorting domain-containing protein [Dyadobacter sandarakinus]|uniref:Gliding motility-associated C-terminal domain-containing protein n=1 Tax=Dyadobacter sandarakinus TaxID=2747268 RepID=A0ABX7I960_9BACT|nr:gliding motility-associated C-terminal domain-containing protein [Dyadobacter sandarakinus]QRR02644.1 gliding motility-associated C-terminal domain-containing protein [Dyadobacter sandarakinus]
MNVRLLVTALILNVVLLFRPDVSAQFCQSTGGFTITPAQGCAPLTVQVSNQVHKAESLTYAFEFDRTQTTAPTTGITQDSAYTYSKPGTYTILQYGSAGGTGFSQCADVVVFETRAPRAELTTCPSGRAMLTIARDSISRAYNFIDVDWGDGQRQSISVSATTDLGLTHNYTPGSTPVVVVSGRYANGQCRQSVSSISLQGSAGQSLSAIRIRSVEMSAAGEAKVLYDGIEGVPTEVLIDRGDGQFVSTGKTGQAGGSQAASISGLDAAKSYRFKLSSRNICDNLVESAVVSSLTVKEVPTALDEIITVAWEHLANTNAIVEYQVKRNGTIVYSTPDQLTFQDTDVQCGNTYQYEIVAVVENDVRSYSASLTLEPKTSAPEIITNASVSVEDNGNVATLVELSGEGLTSSYNLIVERALAGSSDFQQVSPPANTTLQFKDSNVNTDAQSYCYRFSYENACKLKSPATSQPVCTILLSGGAQNVFWNADSPFTGGLASYDLVAKRQDGSIQDQIPMQLGTSYQLDLNAPTIFSFQVKAQSLNPGLQSFSNVLRFRKDAIVQVPDAFTPNGDAYNERFEIKGYFIDDYHLSVYSRWGEVVFQSNNMADSWDGNIKTGKAPGGYYLYKLELTDSNGQKVMKEGSFLLIR